MNYTGEIEVKESLVGNLNMLKVINGYSAYELALKCGYKGTLEEWLESLKVKGEPGTMELFGELDAKGERIMNVADPEEDGDAVNLKCVKDKMSFISKPVKAVLAKREVYGEYSFVYFDVEADWLDYDNLPNGFELTIIPDAQNGGDFTLLRINGGKYVSVKLATHGNITFDSFAAGFPHKLLYFCGGRFDNGNKIDDWYSVTALSEPLRKLSLGNALPIENGGTGGKTAEEAREILSLYSQRQADERFMKLATDITGENIDKVTNQGFYFGENVENSPFNYVFLEVERCMGYIFQRAIDVQNGTIALRRVVSAPPGFTGVEWEYENPPMYWHSQLISPIVYKTTERFNSNPVYTAMIYIDDFEKNKTVDITGNEENENGVYASGIYGKVLRYQGYLYGDNHEYTKTLPYIQPSSEDVAFAWLTFKNENEHSGGKIHMQMHGDNAAFDANGRYICNRGLVQIWFVKSE